MRVLLHACCGPCMLEVYDALVREHEVDVAYANPNIHPLAEYERRKATLLGYARSRDIRVIEAEYDPAAWSRAVAGSESEPSARCPRCFLLRLGITARLASELGYEAVATTLTVSPFQDLLAIAEAGTDSCEEAGVLYLTTDFRHRYGESVTRSKELGMYRQGYCGCLLSEIEAQRARAKREPQDERDR